MVTPEGRRGGLMSDEWCIEAEVPLILVCVVFLVLHRVR